MNHRYSLTLPAVAAIAFILTIFSSTPLPVMAVVAYAVIVERDSWVIKQTLGAFWLSVIISFLHRMLNAITVKSVNPIFMLGLADFVSAILTFVLFIMLAITVLALIRVMRSEDAGLWVLSSLSDWCMGKVRVVPTPPQPQMNPQVQNPERRAPSPTETDRSDSQ